MNKTFYQVTRKNPNTAGSSWYVGNLCESQEEAETLILETKRTNPKWANWDYTIDEIK